MTEPLHAPEVYLERISREMKLMREMMTKPHTHPSGASVTFICQQKTCDKAGVCK